MSVSDISGRRDTDLEPDTFWELIEKLLLHTSRDEKLRERHNASLSALCRGHALPRLPRELKPKQLIKKSTSKLDHNYSATIPINNNRKVCKYEVRVPFGIEKQKPAAVKSPDEQVAPAKQTKSECFINDLKVEYVKDNGVPASERLWRYAIKNSKPNEHTSSNDEPEVPVKHIPSVRSNEAIYNGLKQRLQEAIREKENDARKKKRGDERFKRKRSSNTNLLLIKNNNVSQHHLRRRPPPIKLSPSKTSKSTKKKAAKSSSFVPCHESKNRKSLPNEARVNAQNQPAWVHLDKYEDVHLQPRSVTPDEFEKSKAEYDSIIKKRLRCGNQLETLNKEIVSKRANPRSVLSRDTTRKYVELKSEYLHLCYQESSIRHQIAMLHAEIYMMQNKGFHKVPASVKTITLDSKTAQLNPRYSDTQPEIQRKSSDNEFLLFPRLKAPRPLIVPQRQSFEKYCDRMEQKKASRASGLPQTATIDSETPKENRDEFPYLDSADGVLPRGVCSVYSFTPQMIPPSKREMPGAVETNIADDIGHTKMSHRLPKMPAVRDIRV